MEKIIPFIRIKDRLEEVLDFYLSIFPEMKIRRILPYGVAVAEKEGRMKSCTFEIGGQEFMLSDGEMEEAFTSAISFAVNCDTEEEAARLWDELTEEGEPMVETESYPVYEEYGWVKDRFGISWQIDILSSTQRVVPCLAFAGEGGGRACEAMRSYSAIFEDSRILQVLRYGAKEEGDGEMLRQGRLLLGDREFRVSDSVVGPSYEFTRGISFFLRCDTQEEADRFREELGAGGAKMESGWLRDKFGVYWQVVPADMDEMRNGFDPNRYTEAMEALSRIGEENLITLFKKYRKRR